MMRKCASELSWGLKHTLRATRETEFENLAFPYPTPQTNIHIFYH